MDYIIIEFKQSAYFTSYSETHYKLVRADIYEDYTEETYLDNLDEFFVNINPRYKHEVRIITDKCEDYVEILKKIEEDLDKEIVKLRDKRTFVLTLLNYDLPF